MLPYDITFLDFPKTEYIEKTIIKRIEKLEKNFKLITRSEIVISCLNNDNEENHFYHVEVQAFLSPQNSVVAYSSSNGADLKGIYVAIRDAFDSAERIIQKKINGLHKKNKPKIESHTNKYLQTI